MVLTIREGVYAIQNISTGDYLYPDSGYNSAGQKIFLNEWVQGGAIKWTVTYNPQGGTYFISSFVSNFALRPGIPESGFTQLELNLGPFEWVIAETRDGNGYFIVKGDEQDQVVEADAGGPAALLNNLDGSMSEERQKWNFVTV